MQAGHAISEGAAGRRRRKDDRGTGGRKGLQRTVSPVAVLAFS